MAYKEPQEYTKNEPFIFISYAHKDKDRVYPIIDGLRRRGMRVWYDAELEGGHHWDRGIAEHLAACAHVLCFITESFVVSDNCLNEAYMAYTENKGPIFACLEDVDMPPEMRLNYNRVHKYPLKDYSSWDEFVDRIALTEALRPCCEDLSKLPARKTRKPNPAPPAAPVSKPVAPAKPQSKASTKPQSKAPAVKTAPARSAASSGKGKLVAIVAAALAVLLVLILVIPRIGGNTEPNGSEPAGTGGEQSGSTGPSQPVPEDPSERYALAMDYIQQEKYFEAYEILKALGDYSDSVKQMGAIREAAFLQQIRQAQLGEVVYWGSYEQDAVTSNGKEDIAWVVLHDDSGRKLLLSQSCLDCQPYNEQNVPTSWAKCTLRAWLNDDFYWEAFNDAEQQALHYALIKTESSEDTRDYVSLLSMSEANLYLDLFENGLFSEYSIHQGAGQNLQHWWLRDAENGAYNFGATSYGDKKISELGEQVYRDGVGVRPCIWVDTRTEAEKEAEYAAALNLFEKANYKKALPAFEALGDYKDSLDYCKRLPKLILMKPYMEAEVGDEVRLGNYDWIVVEKQADKILVVSKYSVGLEGFRNNGVYFTWDVSGLRDWLNGQFMTQMLMPGDEKALILPTKVSTSANPEYGTDGGADVTDQIFILSYEEVMKYFPDARDRRLTTAEDTATRVDWWTRTMGQDQNKVVCVDQYGEILLEGKTSHNFVYKAHARPAMWIEIAE